MSGLRCQTETPRVSKLIKDFFLPLNDQNTDILKEYENGDLSLQCNPDLPPPKHEKAFIRFTLNTDTLPSYYNGERAEGNHTVHLEHLNSNKIKIFAVTCRAGYMDSKVVFREYTKVQDLKPGAVDPEKAERGRDEQQDSALVMN